jgi:hypothetical protein
MVLPRNILPFSFKKTYCTYLIRKAVILPVFPVAGNKDGYLIESGLARLIGSLIGWK